MSQRTTGASPVRSHFRRRTVSRETSRSGPAWSKRTMKVRSPSSGARAASCRPCSPRRRRMTRPTRDTWSCSTRAAPFAATPARLCAPTYGRALFDVGRPRCTPRSRRQGHSRPPIRRDHRRQCRLVARRQTAPWKPPERGRPPPRTSGQDAAVPAGSSRARWSLASRRRLLSFRRPGHGLAARTHRARPASRCDRPRDGPPLHGKTDESKKARAGDSWQHQKIALKPTDDSAAPTPHPALNGQATPSRRRRRPRCPDWCRAGRRRSGPNRSRTPATRRWACA